MWLCAGRGGVDSSWRSWRRSARICYDGAMAELDCGTRNLRVFETDDPAVLMVLEKAGSGRDEYGIERDEGLVADLRLFARAAQPA